MTKSYKLTEAIDHPQRSHTFMTLKDEKDNFHNKPSWELINPTKNELVKISKEIIEQINQKILKKIDVNRGKTPPT